MVRVSGVPYEVELINTHLAEVEQAYQEGYKKGFLDALLNSNSCNKSKEDCEKRWSSIKEDFA
jgi:hypothetical protein